MYAQRERIAEALTEFPLIARILELDIFIPNGDRNASAFKRVDFPAPELPIIASNSPGCAIPVTFCKSGFFLFKSCSLPLVQQIIFDRTAKKQFGPSCLVSYIFKFDHVYERFV